MTTHWHTRSGRGKQNKDKIIKIIRNLYPIYGVGLIMVGALLLRLWGLNAVPLWLDESWSKWISNHDFAGIYTNERNYGLHPVAFNAFLHIWRLIAGSTAMALRAPSLLIGALMVPLGFAAARTIKVNPWLTAVLMALSPALLIAARQARPYAMFALAFGVALWLLLRLIRGETGWRLWLGHAMAFEALLWLHPLSVLFGVALGLALLLGLPKRQWRTFFGVYTVIGILWIPAFVLILSFKHVRTHSWLVFSWGTVLGHLTQGLTVFGVFGLFMFVLAALGAATLYRRGDARLANALLITAIVPALLEIIASLLGSPVLLGRTLVPSVLPMLLLIAASVDYARYRALTRVATTLTAVVMLWACVIEVTRSPEEQWDKIDQFIAVRIVPTEEVWTVANDASLPLRDATHSHYPIVPQPMFPSPPSIQLWPEMTETNVAQMIAEARGRHRTGVWLVERYLPWWDPHGILRRQLKAVAVENEAVDKYSPIWIEHWVFRDTGPPKR